VSTKLSQITKKEVRSQGFGLPHCALAHTGFSQGNLGKMNRRAAGGVDGKSAEQFGSELEMQVEAICAQLKKRTYYAPPVRRVEIPKGRAKSGHDR